MPDAIKSLEIILKVVKDSPLAHDQGHFGAHKGRHRPEEDNYCGTSACVAGKIALSPDGAAMGIDHHWTRGSVVSNGRSIIKWMLIVGNPGEISSDWGSLIQYFYERTGIPEHYLTYIFTATYRDHNGKVVKGGENQKKEALRRIRLAIKELKAEKAIGG